MTAAEPGHAGDHAALRDERDALRLAGHVIVEHLDHWCECPLPPDANCEPCRLFSRALAAFRAPAASQEPSQITRTPPPDGGAR